MPSELPRTRRALLSGATRLLAEGGITAPRREACRLWGEAGDRHVTDLLLGPDEPVAPAVAELMMAAASRRARGEPLAHVTGRVGFRRLELRSDRRALIPRPETEGLVDLVLARTASGLVADLGTGTGALGLSLAQEGRFQRVIGVDLSTPALELAAENRALTGLPVELVRGDLCEPLAGQSLDALVSNPPYLTEGEYAALDPAVRDWEPAAALVSGPDGMAATARLLDQGRRVLRPGGWLALEVDCSRAGEAARRAAALGWTDVVIHPDLFGRERYLLARRSASP